jgi:hypothetical protein
MIVNALGCTGRLRCSAYCRLGAKHVERNGIDFVLISFMYKSHLSSGSFTYQCQCKRDHLPMPDERGTVYYQKLNHVIFDRCVIVN